MCHSPWVTLRARPAPRLRSWSPHQARTRPAGPAARRPRAQRRPPGTGWAGARGRWPARCACSAPRPRRRTARPSGTPAPQRREEAAWGSGRAETTRLSKLVGCALSLSVFSLWQSPRSACRVCALPAQRPASPAPRGPARRCPPSARSRTARTCRPARPGSSASPPRRALPASPSAASKKSRAPSRPGAGPGTPAPAPRTTSAAPRAPLAGSWPAVLRRAADGHLGALAGGHELAPSAASKRLHSWMGGRVCLASPR